MPLYEYRCKDCGQVFEKLLPWSQADRSPVCPKCQGQNTQRQVSAIAASASGGSGCGSSGPFS